MIDLLLYVVILCLVFGLIWWSLSIVPLPGPFDRIAQVVLVVIFVICIIIILMGLVGSSPGLRRF
jgi:hypothetical protein